MTVVVGIVPEWMVQVEDTFEKLKWESEEVQEKACERLGEEAGAKLREMFEANFKDVFESGARFGKVEEPRFKPKPDEKPEAKKAAIKPAAIPAAPVPATPIGVGSAPRLNRRRMGAEPQPSARPSVTAEGGGATVTQLRPQAQAKPQPEPQPEPDEPEPEAEAKPRDAWGVLDREAPLDNARKLVGIKYWYKPALMARLRFWQNEFWEWKGKNWKRVDNNTMRKRVYEFLDEAERQVKGYRVRFEPTDTDVNKTMDALKAEVNLEPDMAMPGWLFGPAPVENLRELVALQNGLLNVQTKKLLDHTPRFWSPNVLEFGYDPEARAPRFEQFLEEIFPDDKEAQRCLVEMVGLCLTDETKYHKAFMFVGPRRGGRGTIGRLLRGLIGDENYVGAKLRGMSRQFGMQGWIGKKLALFPDVRTDGLGVDRMSTISETLLTVSGEDSIDVERKYLGAWNGQLTTRVVMFSNELIRFRDDSGALPSRFITWQMRQSFFGREDLNLTAKLLRERPGILNMALEGLDRLRDRGQFMQPGTGAEMAKELEGLASHIALFVADCCIVGPDQEARLDDLYDAWRWFCDRKGIRYLLEEEQFSQKLKSYVHSITRGRPRSGGPSRPTVFTGIGLKKPKDRS
jgi:putative DNA primase/helicase